MIRRNLKERLKAGENLLGTWCLMPSPHAVNVIAKAGFDFVIIDMEHGCMGIESASNMAFAAEADGCHAVVRVPANEESIVLRALELGVDGVIAPHIDSVEDAEAFGKHAKYPPAGKRGFSPYARAGDYHFTKGNTKVQNESVLSGIIVEGLDALKKMDKIAANPNIDLIYVGTYDISSALGIPGEVKDEKVVSILKEAVKKIRAAGKFAGCMAHSREEAEFMRGIGVQFLLYGVDTLAIYEHYSKIRQQVRK